jgi:hypothetical protein
VLNQSSVDGARQAFDALSGDVYGKRAQRTGRKIAQFARGANVGTHAAGIVMLVHRVKLGALGALLVPQLAYASRFEPPPAQASAIYR